ncbi:MAG: PIN domain-containing protein [Deltaproteobacteria bacterium]|nr:PIN domain-containing protein [Deltaproteobacteria bacterium]
MSRVFFDTNLLVYSVDDRDKLRQKAARKLLTEHLGASTAVFSTQVLQEFFSVATRKLGLPVELARDAVHTYAQASVVQVTPDLILSAIDLHRLRPISFWDALVVRAANVANCAILLTEDLTDGEVFDGTRVQDPFAA